jgi:hypothetical protein
MRTPSTVLTLLALASMSGCATAGIDPAARGALLLSEAPPPVGRECHIVPPPDPSIGADQLVDSLALVRDLEEMGGVDHPTGYAIVSLAVDVNGWNSRREVIEHDLPPAAIDSLRALLFRNLRQHQPGDPWGARLRIELGDGVRFQVGHQEVCPPRLRSISDVFDSRTLFDVRATDRAVVSTPLNTVWVRVELDATGMVTDARLQRATFTIRNEAPLLNRVRSLSFDPALIDGIPIAALLSLPLRVR